MILNVGNRVQHGSARGYDDIVLSIDGLDLLPVCDCAGVGLVAW